MGKKRQLSPTGQTALLHRSALDLILGDNASTEDFSRRHRRLRGVILRIWFKRCFISALSCAQQLRSQTRKRSESRQIGLCLPTLLDHLKFSTRSRSPPE